MTDVPVGVTVEADADVIRAKDVEAAKALGYDLNDMLARGEDVTGILKEVRKK